MRPKLGFLFAILIVPVLIIALLYAFGDNMYKVKGNRLAGKELPTLLQILPPTGQPMLVNLAGADSAWDGLRARVGSRVKRIRKTSPFELYLLRSVEPYFSPKAQIQERKVDEALLKKVLHEDLHLPVDTTPIGPWFLLINKDGGLENAYDLSKERLLDTLAIESTILAEQKP